MGAVVATGCSANRYDTPTPVQPGGDGKRDRQVTYVGDGKDQKGEATSGTASARAARSTMYLVTVPAGARPGQPVIINTAQGQMQVAIPPGLRPGDKFRASVPDMPPQRQTSQAVAAIPVADPYSGQRQQTRSAPSTFEVRGAGSRVVNGTYTLARVRVDGVAAYQKRGSNLMLHRYRDSSGYSVWWLADWGPGGQPNDGDDTDYYFCNVTSNTPPALGWRVDRHCRGQLPVPQVVPPGGGPVGYGQNPAYQQNIGWVLGAAPRAYLPRARTNTRRGCSSELIAALPESKYKAKAKKQPAGPGMSGPESGGGKGKARDDDETERCCICLNDFAEDESIRRLPCLHIFHKDCIDEWLRRNHKCPLCNMSVAAGFGVRT